MGVRLIPQMSKLSLHALAAALAVIPVGGRDV